MEICFLGTGAGLPSKGRNVSSIALDLLQEINSVWLFDCGEATQHQILHTTIRPRKINKIFITHLHGDHIFGLPGLISSRSFLDGTDELTVYGPKGIKKFIETSLSVSKTHITYPLHVIEYDDGTIYNDEHFKISVMELEHGIPSYGFKIEEKDKPGQLLVDKLREAGIEPGPIYKQIKENEVTVLDDGRKIIRDHFIGPPKKGRVITIFGDTRFVSEHKHFVSHSDVLIHEATFDRESDDLAKKYFHSTTVQAAKLAKLSRVGTLILTHISSRYQKNDEKRLLQEARDIFPNTLLAQDFKKINIERKSL